MSMATSGSGFSQREFKIENCPDIGAVACSVNYIYLYNITLILISVAANRGFRAEEGNSYAHVQAARSATEGFLHDGRGPARCPALEQFPGSERAAHEDVSVEDGANTR